MEKSVREPPRFLYALVRGIASVFCRFFWGFESCGSENIPKDGPLFLLCSHQGMVDYFFVVAALKKRRLHFVVSQRYFNQRKYKAIFRLFGVIPKVQFSPDPRSIATMLKTVKSGGAVCIFPAGQTSMCGVPAAISPSIARLVKKSGATVATLRLNGSFFTRSRFGKMNRGKTHASMRVILTPQQLSEKSTEQIYKEIVTGIDYNEFCWQEHTGALFHGKNRAFGYEHILYTCPKCGAKYSMASEGNRIYCRQCGNGGIVGEDMHIHPEGPDCRVYPTMLKWYREQQRQLTADIEEQESFSLADDTEVFTYHSQKLTLSGSGRLCLDKDGVSFFGTVNGRQESLAIKHINLPGLSAEAGVYIELSHPQLGLLRFVPKNKAGIVEWKMAQEYLYEKALNEK